jgi:hypothetical protein
MTTDCLEPIASLNKIDRGTLRFRGRSLVAMEISVRCIMSFPWPVTDDELALDDALDLTMRYFDLPSDEEQYAGVESFAGEAIMAEWRRGVRNKVVLANKAIAEVEDHHPLGKKLRPTP